jgi:aspartate aminotransferase
MSGTTSQRLNVRLEAARPSATYRVMDRVASMRASGVEVISLCAGEPDFDTPAHICEAGIAAIRGGQTRYSQVAGIRSLREAVAAKFRRENGLDVRWQGARHVLWGTPLATGV